MSRIDHLVADLCPSGVEFRELGELLVYEQPTKYLVGSTAYDSSYPTPVLTAGQTFILGYTDESAGVFPASRDEPVIIFDDFTTAFRWVDFPFKAKSSAMKMLRPQPNTAAYFKFIYYAMLCIGFAPSEHARHWISQYSKFRIPLPPLEVQHEIVRVLDLFTELEAKLEVELEARRRQYEHYRDVLLTFPERERERVRWLTLGDVATFRRGTAMTAEGAAGGAVPVVANSQLRSTFTTSAIGAVRRSSWRDQGPTRDSLASGIGRSSSLTLSASIPTAASSSRSSSITGCAPDRAVSIR